MRSKFDASPEHKLLTIAFLYAFRACLLSIVLDLFMLSIPCVALLAKVRSISHMPGTQLKTVSD